MSSKQRVARNIVWNCAGTGVEAVAGFLIAPFLIHHLGDTTYGLWIVLGSLTSYFGLLDLGVRGSVGRYVAYHQAAHDQRALNETLSTALALLAAVGLLAFGCVLAVLPFFFSLFAVPPELVAGVRLALLIVGVNLGLSLVANAFDAALWGFQRFDLLNMVDIPTSLARLGLTLYCVGRGGGLVQLAVITLGLTVVNGLVKAVLTYRENRGLRLRPRHVRRAAVREIFGYSVWSFIGSVTKMTRAQLSPLLIASLVGVASVTPFAIASRLLNYAALAVQSATGALTPLATALHVQKHGERQRQLFLTGGKYCCALALFLTALLLLLGRPFITLWTGPRLLGAVPLMVVLALGEVLPNAQWVTNGMLFAAARHRSLAYLNLIEAALVTVLTVVLLKALGPIGACFALAVPGCLLRGAAQVLLGCRLAQVSVWRYTTQALLPALAAAVPPSAVLGAAVAWHAPASWAELVLYAMTYGVLFAGSCVLFFPFERGRHPVALAAGRLSGACAVVRRKPERVPSSAVPQA
jgi:O-antigen/teichoic acid export membrane protein